MFKRIKSLLEEDKGQALILVAISLIVLLGATALTADYGYLAWQRRSLQNAADAGALAAAMDLPHGKQAKIETQASKYANNHVNNSFKSANISLDKRKVEVTVEKSYERFFGKIFGNELDTLTAIATAERYNNWYDLILPLGLRDNYGGGQDHLDLSGYIDYLEEYYVGETIPIWGKDDEATNLKFGALRLGPFSPSDYKENKPIDKVIDDGIDKSIYGWDLHIEEGMSANKKTFQNRFDIYGNSGYIIGVLPSRASYLEKNPSETLVPWGEYILLYFTNLNIPDKGEIRLEGTLSAVYDITTEEIPVNSDLAPVKRSRLIK